MEIKKVYAVYFSPTDGTKNYICAAANMLCQNYAEFNLTDFDARRQTVNFNADDLVLLGVPVYFGRVPQVDGGVLGMIKGCATRVIIFAIYGNRNYEDALLELKNLACAQGFVPIAAAALIAPHTFCKTATRERPTLADTAALDTFMQSVKSKLADEAALNVDLSIKGNYPYRTYGRVPFCPTTNANCTACGICYKICPVRAISAQNMHDTDKGKCIACMACVKACPTKARGLYSFIPKTLLKLLEHRLAKQAKQAEFFL